MSSLPIYALIVAGGKGTRMGTELPKQFLPLHHKEIILHTILAFVNAQPNIKIIVVHPASHREHLLTLLETAGLAAQVQLVIGGDTRFDSVKNGLQTIPDTNGIVLIHDGVRPLVSAQLIHACIAQAETKGSAIPAVGLVDSIRRIQGDTHTREDRATLVAVQTPQTFQIALIKKAFEQNYQDAFTDDASVVEAMQLPIHLIAGERYNIKITTPEDVIIAEALLAHVH